MADQDGKVVYITGGSKGIGLGIAQVLLGAGYRVAISGRSDDSLLEAAAILGNSNAVMTVKSDVTKPVDEEKAAKGILEHWGQIDIVIANAGIGHFAPVDEMSLESWNQMIDTNLNGVFYTLRAAVEALKVSKGYFMTIASLAGTNFFANGAGYNATKFGLVGFTQAAMLDLRKYDIKVTTIMPGSVATYFNQNTPSEKDDWKIQPKDIGQIVLDLLEMPARSLPSKIEVRPSRPDLK
jgi:NADP-dependent 3-hydroxy acid dehydrogenase YdfG